MQAKQNFEVEDGLLTIYNADGESISLDTTLKKHTFLFQGTQMKYSMHDGKSPAFSMARGCKATTWGGLMREIRIRQGEMSFLILGTTMQVTYKSEETITHFRFRVVQAK
jgi:hypothetical protein